MVHPGLGLLMGLECGSTRRCLDPLTRWRPDSSVPDPLEPQTHTHSLVESLLSLSLYKRLSSIIQLLFTSHVFFTFFLLLLFFSYRPSFLPVFLPSCLTPFHQSYITSFLPSFLHSFLSAFLPSCLVSVLSSYHRSFLPPTLPYILSFSLEK